MLALVHSKKEEKKRILEMGLFLVSHFLNAVEHVECRNMFWHLEKCVLASNTNNEAIFGYIRLFAAI